MPDAQSLAPAEIQRSSAPLVPETAVPACEVCGGSDTFDIASGFDYELITCRNHWQFVECTTCGQVWLNPRPATEALDVIYPSTYYAYNYDDISGIARKGKQLMDARKMRKILAHCEALPERYLDVGCGDGRYLETLNRKGVPREGLYGLELDNDVVASLQARGLNAYCERVESCEQFAEGTFDLISMFHVIEHVESPRAVVRRLADWLKPGGVLAMETPNTASLDARIWRSGRWGGYHIPRHWHLFNPTTFRRLLESEGLIVDAVKYETGHAFWMYSIHHVLRYGRHPRPRLARFFDPFQSVLPLAAFTALDRARGAVGGKTSAMLFIARKPSGVS